MKNSSVDSLQTSLLIIFLVIVSFPLSTIGTVSINQVPLLGLLVLLVMAYHHFFFQKVAKTNKHLALYIEIVPFILLVPMLILATGGFLSPLLIIAHLTAISLSILVNPTAALSFLLTTLSVLVMHFLIIVHPDPQVNISTIIAENISLIFISFLSFIATIPLFTLFSGHEKTQSEWLKYLDKQVSTSEAEEKALLSNLNDAVIVTNPQGFVVLMNDKAENLVGASQIEVVGKPYTEVLKLSDNSNKSLTDEPLQRSLSTNKSLILKDLRLENDKLGIKARVKFSPIKDRQLNILGCLIVVSNTTSASEIEEIQNDNLALALFKFNTLLSDARSYNATLLEDKSLKGVQRTYVDRLLHINQDLLRLVDDFLFSVRLSQEEVGISVAEVKLGKLIEEILVSLDILAQKEKVSHEVKTVNDVTIRTDRKLLQKALVNLLVVATRLSEDKNIIALDMVEEADKIKLYINFTTGMWDLDIKSLREKFFGGSELFSSIPKANGLEVYLADNILPLLGGSVSITKNPNNPKQVEFLVILPSSKGD